MADRKISQLPDGGDAEPDDEVPVNRGGLNYKVLLRTVISREARSDFVDPYSYIGIAPNGSLESDPVWLITRIDVGPPVVVATATNVAWDDRLTETYT
jgi:hypothetical protein